MTVEKTGDVEADVLLSRLNTLALLVYKKKKLKGNALAPVQRECKIAVQFHMRVVYYNVNLLGFSLRCFHCPRFNTWGQKQNSSVGSSAYALLKEQNRHHVFRLTRSLALIIKNLCYLCAKLNKTQEHGK